MKGLQKYSLVFVAFILGIHAFNFYVIPVSFFVINREALSAATSECLKAKQNQTNALKVFSQIKSRTQENLKRSMEVELQVCNSYQLLKHKALGYGVSPDLIRSVEIEAAVRNGLPIDMYLE